MTYTIIDKFIPTSKYAIKAPYSMNPETITIHNTWNDAAALSEVTYMTSNANQVSYHVAVDDKHVVQAIPFSRNAWHAGDGQGAGNRKSIGIEICYSKSGGAKYTAAEENAIDYVAHILKDKGWGIDRVKWHKDWSGKNCPHRILEEGRAASVRNRIVKRLQKLKSGGVTASVPPVSERGYLMEGDSGAEVKKLQEDLNQAGFKLTVDGIFGEGTKEAVLKFQLRTNLERDGIAGASTKAKLAAVIAQQPKPKEEVKVAEEYKKDAQPSKSLAPEYKETVKAGITDGTYPQRPATREEVAVMVYRAFNKKQ
ncbi:N-acetylmuramoyl-L-alanine amidase CwlA precursor [Planococcus massiliensis]|uniref:N-acetylmuramoyl-L-alanine amidase n=1 Tax=Planococcus massiliensis TaxID=1499687 RepID=A0A098EP89_9BACL|nr:N-acetylmuramoyl-L-alanine amidase [Planococcus massiliensis]CEG23116.1 N-acetylmuramoyl-L-alanine amidase CwlA precursor [Planococcus massiliensis]